jgi:hypothetical protein
LHNRKGTCKVVPSRSAFAARRSVLVKPAPGLATEPAGGAEKDAIKFDFQKVAPRTYKIVLTGLKKGEYGILPPGGGAVGGGASGQTVQGGSMQSGKLYTFGIIE